MASGNNNSDGNSTLPLPELNPLLNPVLSAHMGRWAEVYFTTPPEKRDGAVLELLRELQGGTAAPRRRAVPEEQVSRKTAKRPPEPESVEESQAEWTVCESCGGRNILGNKFCGMCAAPIRLTNIPPSEPQPDETWGKFLEREQHAREGIDPGYETDLYEADRSEQEIDRRIEPIAAAVEREELRPSHWPPRPDIPSLLPEYEPAPNRRRLYVGMVLAILIGGLLYVAWRGAAARSESSHQLPLAAPAIAETQPTAPDPTPPSAAQVEPRQDAVSKAPITQRNTVVATSRPLRTIVPNTEPNPTLPPESSTDQTTPLVATLHGNGSEELTVAQSYLNGTHGRAHDSSEAAKWLWRSFGKKNASAALLLSDLYVRGDGVPQSCDQARVLLDAAARNGAPAAAEKLKDLPSQGCQ